MIGPLKITVEAVHHVSSSEKADVVYGMSACLKQSLEGYSAFSNYQSVLFSPCHKRRLHFNPKPQPKPEEMEDV